MRRLDGKSSFQGSSLEGVSNHAKTVPTTMQHAALSGQFSLETDDASAAIHSPRSFFLPVRYEPRYNYPLIVWLHSDGSNELQIEQVMPHVSLQNFVAVGIRGVRAIDSVGHCFDWPHSAASVHAACRRVASVIEEAQTRFSIHTDRIILAGYGAGGTMAMRLGLQQPNSFAGIVSVGGDLPRSGRLFSDLSTLRTRKLPILWQQAVGRPCYDSDLLVDDLKQLMVTGSRVEVRQYADDDEMNTVTLSDINEWVMHRIVLGDVATESQRTSTTSGLVAFSTN